MNKICPVCTQKFETRSGPKEKTTCSRSCSNTYFKDIRYSPKSNAKRSEALLGRKRIDPTAYVTKQCIVCKSDFVRRRCIARTQQTCGKKECFKVNQSRVLKGKTGGPRSGGGRGKQTKYAGIMWDSTWEARLAKRLDTLEIKWVRPGKELRIPYVALNGSERNYYPDIFLPSLNIYIEVKGHWTPESRHRVQQCQLTHQIIVLETLKAIDSYQ